MAGALGILVLDVLIFVSDICIALAFFAVWLNLKRKKAATGVSLQTLYALIVARGLHVKIFGHTSSSH